MSTAAKKAGPATKGLRVVARRHEGFRRAGIQFGPEATDIPLSELSPEQHEAIVAEGKPGGQLVVLEIDIPKAEKA